jgi:sodium-independent sulfate anion transporter 11
MNWNKAQAYLNEKRRSFFDTTTEERRKQTASLEQIARETINETYHEDDPSVAEWFKDLVPSSAGVAEYVRELFPSARWVRRYNKSWLVGDLIAGKYSAHFVV